MAKFVVECEPDTVLLRRVYPNPFPEPIGKTDLPSYVTKLATDNTELTEQITELKDFVRDVCHALEMSLESRQCDLLNRIRSIKSGKRETRYLQLKTCVEDFIFDLESKEFVTVGGEE